MSVKRLYAGRARFGTLTSSSWSRPPGLALYRGADTILSFTLPVKEEAHSYRPHADVSWTTRSKAAAAQPHASFIRPPRLIFLITLNCCYPASLINHLDYFNNDRKKEEGSTQISETESFAEVYKTNLKGIYVRSTMSSKFWLASSFDPRTLLGPILRHKCDPHF